MNEKKELGTPKPDTRVLWEVLGLEQTREIKTMKSLDGEVFQDLHPAEKITNVLHFKTPNGHTVSLEINEKDLERVMPQQRKEPPSPDKMLGDKSVSCHKTDDGVEPAGLKKIKVGSLENAMGLIHELKQQYKESTTEGIEFLPCDEENCFGVLALVTPKQKGQLISSSDIQTLHIQWGFPEYNGRIPPVFKNRLSTAQELVQWILFEEEKKPGSVTSHDDPKAREIGFISTRLPDRIEKRVINLTALKGATPDIAERVKEWRDKRRVKEGGIEAFLKEIHNPDCFPTQGMLRRGSSVKGGKRK